VRAKIAESGAQCSPFVVRDLGIDACHQTSQPSLDKAGNIAYSTAQAQPSECEKQAAATRLKMSSNCPSADDSTA
jgi:hypothetical protein